MNNELLLLIKKHTDILNQQTKTKLQETFEFEMNKQMETFSFSPPTNLVKERKWLLTVTFFEIKSSVFNINYENNSFLISTPGYWSSRRGALIIQKLQNLLELRSQNDIRLHVVEVRRRGSLIKGDSDYRR